MMEMEMEAKLQLKLNAYQDKTEKLTEQKNMFFSSRGSKAINFSSIDVKQKHDSIDTEVGNKIKEYEEKMMKATLNKQC